MRLLGRGWQQSLIGAYEKPPAMPEDIYLFSGNELFVEGDREDSHSEHVFLTAY